MIGHVARLFAVSDLHVGFAQNRQLVSGLRSQGDDDWLIVAGDVGEFAADIEWALGMLSERFAKVFWAPGNHELWTHPREPLTLRGVDRYEHLVGLCSRRGVVHTADWPVRDRAAAVVDGPLHIPRTTWHDGVRHEEVSLGYPREWRRRAKAPVIPRQILPQLSASPSGS